MEKLYSPTQIAIGTFIGGPFAAIYFMKKNFDALGEYQKTRVTVLWGAFLTLSLMFAIPFIPESVPNAAIPAGYTAFVAVMVQQHMLSKEEIKSSSKYKFRSSFGVLFVSLIALALFFASTTAMFGALVKYDVIVF